ncbi:DUF1294 domain-containing protein [Candidatus Uhrbacteria bacterium]|nr:DUF1294 domain-containing protein [Candidatus Uhrbacteria bacterium]
MNPDLLRGLIIWALLSVGAFLFWVFIPEFQIVPVWGWGAISSNAATCALVFLDKVFARVGFRRIPEMAFYLATFLGGSFGMLVGMYAFSHKTRKTSFQIVVGALVLAQAAMVVWMGIRL